MSHDPSRLLYAHIGCGNVPCTCVWDHPPLAVLEIQCSSCVWKSATMTLMANHHLKVHERPLPARYASLFLAPTPPLLLLEEGAGDGSLC